MYSDWNPLSTVRARDDVTHIFPLADTLCTALLTAACQCGLTCHWFQTNYAQIYKFFLVDAIIEKDRREDWLTVGILDE